MRTRRVLALSLSTPLALAEPPPTDYSKIEVKTNRLSSSVAELEGDGGNIGVSFGDDGVFVIDDEFAPLAAKIKAALAALSKQPLRFVFNTHWHGDHTGGNEAFAGSGVTIVAHDNVRERLRAGQFMALMNKQIPPAPVKALPVITFSDEMSFFLNGDELHVFHVAHAHTDGDAIIYFKNANVLHAGDTFVTKGFPIIDTSSGGGLDGSVTAAHRMLALCDDRTRIIPGHGDVTNKAKLIAWRDMIVKIRDRIGKAKAEHKTLEQVTAMKPTAEYDAEWGHWFIKPDVLVALAYETIGKYPKE